MPSFRLQAWGGGEVGALPQGTPLFGGEAGIVLVNFRLMLGAEIFLSQNRALTAGAATDAHAQIGLAAATLDVGYTFHPGAFEFGPLAGFEVGSLHASSVGVTGNGSGGSLWDAARVGGFGGWFPTRHLGVTTRVEAAFPFSRPTFVLQPTSSEVHRPGVVSGRLVGGVELRL